MNSLTEYSGPPALMKSAVREVRSFSDHLDNEAPIEMILDLFARQLGYLRLLAACAACPLEAVQLEHRAERHVEAIRRILERRGVV